MQRQAPTESREEQHATLSLRKAAAIVYDLPAKPLDHMRSVHGLPVFLRARTENQTCLHAMLEALNGCGKKPLVCLNESGSRLISVLPDVLLQQGGETWFSLLPLLSITDPQPCFDEHFTNGAILLVATTRGAPNHRG